MAINVSRAAKLVTDSEGYVTATLDSITEQTKINGDGKDNTQLQWIFKIPTSKKTADKYLWTGCNVNSQRTYYPVDADGVVSKTGEYNKLTQLLLSLKLITEAEVLSDEDIELDLETLIGKEFKFKVIPDRDKPALSDIVVTSVQLVK